MHIDKLTPTYTLTLSHTHTPTYQVWEMKGKLGQQPGVLQSLGSKSWTRLNSSSIPLLPVRWPNPAPRTLAFSLFPGPPQPGHPPAPAPATTPTSPPARFPGGRGVSGRVCLKPSCRNVCLHRPCVYERKAAGPNWHSKRNLAASHQGDSPFPRHTGAARGAWAGRGATRGTPCFRGTRAWACSADTKTEAENPERGNPWVLERENSKSE